MIFGLILIIFPRTGALAMIIVIGIYAIIFGIVLLVLAWRLRQMDTGHASPVGARIR